MELNPCSLVDQSGTNEPARRDLQAGALRLHHPTQTSSFPLGLLGIPDRFLPKTLTLLPRPGATHSILTFALTQPIRAQLN